MLALPLALIHANIKRLGCTEKRGPIFVIPFAV
jgi:hypothetical protein